MSKIANEAARAGRRESQRVTPEVPLECDDRKGAHAHPDHAECRFSPCKARVEESKTRRHDQHHGGGDDDVRLVASLKPLIEIDDG